MTIVNLFLLKVELYSAKDWKLCKMLPDLRTDKHLGDYRLRKSAIPLMTEVSTTRKSVMVLDRGDFTFLVKVKAKVNVWV